MSETAGQSSGAPEVTGDRATGGALRELSLELIAALRQLLDLAEAAVSEPELMSGLVRSGRGLVESVIPPESLASARRAASQIVADLVPAERREQLLATLATIVAPSGDTDPDPDQEDRP